MSDTEGTDDGATENVAEDGAIPDYMPEQFWKDGAADVEGLAKSYNEMGTKIREKTESVRKTLKAEIEADRISGRPETANHYEVKIPDSLKEGFVEGMDFEFNDTDPMMIFWKDFAFEQGLGQEGFEAGLSAYITAAFAALPDYEHEMSALGENGVDRAKHVNGWAQSTLSEETYNALQAFAVTADGVKAIEELMRNSGQPAFAPGDGSTAIPGTITLTQLREMQADPRYWDPANREEAWIKKVEAGYVKLVS